VSAGAPRAPEAKSCRRSDDGGLRRRDGVMVGSGSGRKPDRNVGWIGPAATELSTSLHERRDERDEWRGGLPDHASPQGAVRDEQDHSTARHEGTAIDDQRPADALVTGVVRHESSYRTGREEEIVKPLVECPKPHAGCWLGLAEKECLHIRPVKQEALQDERHQMEEHRDHREDLRHDVHGAQYGLRLACRRRCLIPPNWQTKIDTTVITTGEPASCDMRAPTSSGF
jgi:hypothetical protein